MTANDRILNAIGAEAMAALCREFGGDVIYVPQDLPAPERDDDIIHLFSDTLKGGASTMNAYQACKDEFNVSVRTVQRVIVRGVRR